MGIWNPANAACIAAILVAIGVETSDAQVRLILEAVGIVVAASGLILGWLRAGRN